MACNHIIGFSEGIVRAGWEGRGFGRRYIIVQRCPKCGAEHRTRKNWQGPAPRGGFSCNATSTVESYVSEGLGETQDFCPSDNT